MKSEKTKQENAGQAVSKDLWIRLYKRVGKYWKGLALAILCTILGSATQPAMAYLMKPLLDEGFNGVNADLIWMMPLAIIGLMFVRAVFNFSGEYLLAWVANKVLFFIRADMFTKLLYLPDTFFQQGDTGRLLNRFTIDANEVTDSASDVAIIVVKDTAVVLSLVAMLLYLSWQLTLVILLVFPIAIWVGRFFAKRLRSINRHWIDWNAKLTGTVKEAIEGQRVIKLFSGYEREQKRFQSVNSKLRGFSMRSAVAGSLISPLTQWIISFAVAGVIYVALYQGHNGALTVGGFIAFITALGQIFDPVRRLTNVTAKAQKMMMAAESVFKLIDGVQEVDKGTLECHVKPDSVIQFNQVSFKFETSEKNTIDHINLTVPAGQTVAIVGRSGGGKTTLVNMLPRFIEPTQGEITIDGIALNQFTLGSLRDKISLVSQQVVLFEGSIADNVRYGFNYTVDDAQVEEALRSANLWEFAQQLPQGLDTMVGENGSWLSGGQRQRLAIARALIKNAPILILDEATSALDNESEHLVQESLEHLMKGRTTFVIAHRLSTIKNANRIIVVDKGKIIQEGTHEELLKSDGLYQSLYQLQFKENT